MSSTPSQETSPKPVDVSTESADIGGASATLSLPVSGAVVLNGQTLESPFLRWDEHGLYIAGPPEQDEGGRLSLIGRNDVRYESGRLRDRLHVGAMYIVIPAGDAKRVRQVIAKARLGLPPVSAGPRPQRHLLEKRTPMVDIWLDAWLDDGEALLAVVRTAEKVSVESTWVDDPAPAPRYVVLSTSRCVTVAVGPLGDVSLHEFSAEALGTATAMPKGAIRIGDETIRPTLTNRSEFAQLSRVIQTPERSRVLVMAELLWAADPHRYHNDVVVLLDRLASQNDQWGPLTKNAIRAYDAEGLSEPAMHQIAAEMSSQKGDAGEPHEADLMGALPRWADTFGLPPNRCMEVVSAFRTCGTEPAALRIAIPLHAQTCARNRALLDFAKGVEAGLHFAEHQLEADLRNEARETLEALATELPPASPLGLRVSPRPSEGPLREPDAPPEPLRIDDSQKQHRLRIRVLDHLAGLRCGSAGLDPETLLELAREDPLDRIRWKTVAELGPVAHRNAAETIFKVLGPRALASPAPPPVPASRLLPATDHQLVQMRHPASHQSSALEKVQQALATATVPNHGVLRDYCEKLSEGHPVMDVVADACITFGTAGLSVYVSRGTKSVGLRAYEGKPNFILVGAEHLDESSPHFLSEGELRFLVATEVAHLRFGHTRLTSSEVWNGAYDKGKATVEIVLSIFPGLKVAKLAHRFQPITRYVRDDTVKRIMQRARRIVGHSEKPEGLDTSIDQGTEVLIQAHRLMQLSADRAGYWFGGDIRAAIMAMFKLRPSYLAELPIAKRESLPDALHRRTESSAPFLGDMAMRIGALFDFMVSRDLEQLRELNGRAPSVREAKVEA